MNSEKIWAFLIHLGSNMWSKKDRVHNAYTFYHAKHDIYGE